MYLERLRIRDFRCFETTDIDPSPAVNVLVGENASGKTSVLEAIYYLGRGQSFRPTPARQAIRRGATAFSINADITRVGGRRHRLGVSRDRQSIQYKLDQNRQTKRLDLVTTLPLQLVDPNVHRLLEQGPRFRRHFLDWGVFHVEHSFFPAWQRYRRALRQRNHALRDGFPKKDVIVWDAELVSSGETVDACRRGYIESLRECLPDSTRAILGGTPPVLEYDPGWRGNDGYGAALLGSLSRDQRSRFTNQGPHRADLRVRVAEEQARDWVSRGQQKVLTTALLLAQAELLKQRRGMTPVLLLDDMAAELGEAYRHTLMDAIVKLQGQCFLTFLDSALVPTATNVGAMFHVEHGWVTPA